MSQPSQPTFLTKSYQINASAFVLILHCPPSFIGPYIFLIVLLSHVFKAHSFPFARTHVSLAYIAAAMVAVVAIEEAQYK
jgi:hypothetical protein